MALLTDADKKNIQHIWAKLFENPEENGKTVVIKLFKDYPETKAYFKTIPTEGNLQEDPLVRFHGRRVMVALNQVVENLDNWKQACRILDRLADKHKNVHQVPAVNFQVLMHADIRKRVCLGITAICSGTGDRSVSQRHNYICLHILTWLSKSRRLA
nr:hemoglobin subunit alpha-D-like isoform X1 [Chelonoidis abingdonii]